MLKILLLSCLISCGAYADEKSSNDEKSEICNSVVTIYKNSYEMANNNVELRIAIAAATQLYEGSSSGYDVVLYIIRKGYYDALHKRNIDKQSAILKNTCIKKWLKDKVDKDHEGGHDKKSTLYMI